MFIIPALRLRQEDQFEARLGYSKTPSQQIKTKQCLDGHVPCPLPLRLAVVWSKFRPLRAWCGWSLSDL